MPSPFDLPPTTMSAFSSPPSPSFPSALTRSPFSSPPSPSFTPPSSFSNLSANPFPSARIIPPHSDFSSSAINFSFPTSSPFTSSASASGFTLPSAPSTPPSSFSCSAINYSASLPGSSYPASSPSFSGITLPSTPSTHPSFSSSSPPPGFFSFAWERERDRKNLEEALAEVQRLTQCINGGNEAYDQLQKKLATAETMGNQYKNLIDIRKEQVKEEKNLKIDAENKMSDLQLELDRKIATLVSENLKQDITISNLEAKYNEEAADFRMCGGAEILRYQKKIESRKESLRKEREDFEKRKLVREAEVKKELEALKGKDFEAELTDEYRAERVELEWEKQILEVKRKEVERIEKEREIVEKEKKLLGKKRKAVSELEEKMIKKRIEYKKEKNTMEDLNEEIELWKSRVSDYEKEIERERRKKWTEEEWKKRRAEINDALKDKDVIVVEGEETEEGRERGRKSGNGKRERGKVITETRSYGKKRVRVEEREKSDKSDKSDESDESEWEEWEEGGNGQI